jgi:hypothetical protein
MENRLSPLFQRSSMKNSCCFSIVSSDVLSPLHKQDDHANKTEQREEEREFE